MKATRLALVLGVVIAAVAATSALAMTGNPLSKHGAKERQHKQAAALGKKLGIAPSRVSRALGEIRGERRDARRTRRAAELGKRLGVSPAAAKTALSKGVAAAKAAGKGNKPGKAFRAAVAKELGKSPEEVGKALKAVRTAKLLKRLEAAERNGAVSGKRADRLRKKIESGKHGRKVAGALR